MRRRELMAELLGGLLGRLGGEDEEEVAALGGQPAGDGGADACAERGQLQEAFISALEAHFYSPREPPVTMPNFPS